MKAIAAMSANRVIGAQGKIPWHLPEDLKFFKRTTLGHVVLMGRKTYASIGRPLPGRENWVVSRSADVPGVIMVRDLDRLPQPPEGREVFVIGGSEVYAALLPRCEELYLTLVRREVEGDVVFPGFEDAFDMVEVIEGNSEMEIRRYRRR